MNYYYYKTLLVYVMLCYCVPPPTSMGLYSSLISGGKEKIFPLFLRMEKERSLKILFVSHKFPFKPFLGVLGVFILQISWKNTHPTHTTYTHLIVILLRPANNNRHHPGSPTLHPLHVTTETGLRFGNIKHTDRHGLGPEFCQISR